MEMFHSGPADGFQLVIGQLTNQSKSQQPAKSFFD